MPEKVTVNGRVECTLTSNLVNDENTKMKQPSQQLLVSSHVQSVAREDYFFIIFYMWRYAYGTIF